MFSKFNQIEISINLIIFLNINFMTHASPSGDDVKQFRLRDTTPE